MARTPTANPACTNGDDLPPAPFAEHWDPAEPHPDEPGAPADSPPRRGLDQDTQELRALVEPAQQTENT